MSEKELLQKVLDEDDENIFAKISAVIFREMLDDDQTPELTGREVVEALVKGSAADLLLAITGRNPLSILEMATGEQIISEVCDG